MNFLVSTMLFSLTAVVLFTMLTSMPKHMSKSEHKLAFNCGMANMSPPHQKFSSHFFLIGIVFILFDLELLVINHLLPTLKNSPKTSIFWAMFVFFMWSTLILEASLLGFQWKT